MTTVTRVDGVEWRKPQSQEAVAAAQRALEAGHVLFLPALPFAVEPLETLLFTPSILGSSKNASYDPASGRLGGTTATGHDAETLRRFVHRFSESAASLVDQLLPAYRGRIVRGRASFRPAELAGRRSSWRKDDTRLHVDSFPATPSGGRRILRVFSNVNPEGRARAWRLGDDFEAVARRFAPQLRVPLPGMGHLLALVRVTRTPRSAYDALMLQLHDCMKGDEAFQKESPQSRVDLPAGSTWLAFTDQVSHAATSGQYQLEQTFLLPVDAMGEPQRSPLRILERITGRALL
ncbi:MAG TPA: Kdo hydroxylase family protein [Vicinamibacterales bacterium]|nr:Kdo hydroxylase family protein [Vicinamibacterales bacterium]